MTKIIIDTSVFITIFLKYSHHKGTILRIIRDFEICFSQATFEELKQSMQKPKIRQNADYTKFAQLVPRFMYHCSYFEPTSTVIFERDPKDAKFLELARDSNANYIVSGDKDMLEFGVFENTKIITLGEFLEKYHLN